MLINDQTGCWIVEKDGTRKRLTTAEWRAAINEVFAKHRAEEPRLGRAKEKKKELTADDLLGSEEEETNEGSIFD